MIPSQTVIRFAKLVKAISLEHGFAPRVREGVGQLTISTRELAKHLSRWVHFQFFFPWSRELTFELQHDDVLPPNAALVDLARQLDLPNTDFYLREWNCHTFSVLLAFFWPGPRVGVGSVAFGSNVRRWSPARATA